jgi:hypothetical protein
LRFRFGGLFAHARCWRASFLIQSTSHVPRAHHLREQRAEEKRSLQINGSKNIDSSRDTKCHRFLSIARGNSGSFDGTIENAFGGFSAQAKSCTIFSSAYAEF